MIQDTGIAARGQHVRASQCMMQRLAIEEWIRYRADTLALSQCPILLVLLTMVEVVCVATFQ
jgi:hypothetical protein